MYTMLARIVYNLSNIFLTADDVPVATNLINCNLILMQVFDGLANSFPFHVSETSHLSTVSMCTIVPKSISGSVYVPYLALFPGQSHLPSPANENVLL